jgi:hybrid cluster-associated redox disulfide protein
MGTGKKLVTKDSVIGEVIKENPGARDIIQKYFGGGCFTCPGINMESLAFGSMMHNLDPDKIVDEINRLSEDSVAAAKEG